ncbi:MAG: hypothetical protein ACREQV_23810, partial [Candidatus Binatia bacterium]
METTREEVAPRGSDEETREEESLRRGHSEGRGGERATVWQNSSRRRRNASQAGLNNGSDDRLAEALGWFSIGLGLAAIAAPRGVSRLIGIGDHRRLLQAVGLREMASGIGILTNRGAAGWLWSRVAGDFMDLALLRMASSDERTDRGR